MCDPPPHPPLEVRLMGRGGGNITFLNFWMGTVCATEPGQPLSSLHEIPSFFGLLRLIYYFMLQKVDVCINNIFNSFTNLCWCIFFSGKG